MTTKFGKYTLLKRLAVGGMAEVFLGVATGAGGFKKHVAIKRILPDLSDEREFVSMFFDEARILARFNHPNIVQIFDLGRVKDTYFLAMEYIEGLSMDKVLKLCAQQGRRLPMEYAVKIISDTCDALDYAHNFTGLDGEPLQVVHRDVSPQNVMVTYDGVIKVLDFGIAKAAGNLTKTHPSFLKGKVLFMSPEQITQAEGLDHRSDIFSLGTMLYILMTNKRPFKGKTELEVMMSIARDEVPDPRSVDSSVPAKLCRVIERAMEKNRSRRYQTARAMRDDLERFLFERQMLVDKHVLSDFLHELVPDRKARADKSPRTPPPIPAPSEPEKTPSKPAVVPAAAAEDDLNATVDERPRQPEESSPEKTDEEDAPWEGDTAKRVAVIDTVRDGKPFDGVASRRSTPVLILSLVVLLAAGGGFLAWKLLGTDSGPQDPVHPPTEPRPLPGPGGDPWVVDGGKPQTASADPVRPPAPPVDAGTRVSQPPADRTEPDGPPANDTASVERPDPDPDTGTVRKQPRAKRRRRRRGDPKRVIRRPDPDETPDEQPGEQPPEPVPEPDVAQEVTPSEPDGGSPPAEPDPRVAKGPDTGKPVPDPGAHMPPRAWPPPGYRPTYQPPEVVTKRRIQGAEPAFPSIARQAGLEATILVKVYIDPEGRVGKTKFLKSNKYFEQAVIDAIQTWRFRPHTINGRAVGTYTVYKFVFEQD